MSDDEKKTGQEMTEEEMAKEWEKMMDQVPDPPEKTDAPVDSYLDTDPMNMSVNTDTMGLAGSIKNQNRTTAEAPNIDFLLDIPLEISAELGRTKMIIYDLLQLSQGSVIELNKMAGDSLDIRVNDKLIARGEAVVINEKFGVRITDIVNPQERIENLRGEE